MYMGLEILWFILYSLLGLLIYGLMQALVTIPGRTLQENFRSLGTLTGKRKAEIIAKAGNPSSVSELPDGKILLQWMATGYHIALVFNGDICEGVSHESANF